MTLPFLNILLVFIGGGIGSVARYLTNLWALANFGPHYPWGTFTVNVVGSALMGSLTAFILARWAPDSGGNELRLFFTTGILGGFTTFSAFSLDTIVLWERGAIGQAVLYVASTIIVSFAVLAFALVSTRSWLA
ncbi:MAG: fluoride efflux transporter CrcB [Ancalomicrobiaceae bacterium]|nr:fluoride efflux transporter CrcB [Ancalomicrobiaceae bacterium]